MMRILALSFGLLLAGVGADDSIQSPIQKVVALVTDMKAQTIKEGEDDQQAYDKYKCWCATSEGEKTGAVKAAETKLQELTSFVEEAAAKEGQLKTEIAGLKEDIAADQDSLASATSMRAEENAEFKTEEADMKNTLELLSEAITVLSKAQLLQKSQRAKALVQVRSIVTRVAPRFGSVMQKDLFDLLGEFKGPAEEEEHLSAFLAAPEGAAAGSKSYNARSGGILGILNAQKDGFSGKLSAAQKSEMQSLSDFQKLSAAKNAEIAAATKQQDNKELELANLLDAAAKAKEDIEATQATLTADEAFLVEMTANCASEDEEYAKRSKVRNEEVEALAETLKILTGDEARDLFGKTISLMQVGTHHRTISFSNIAAAQDAARSQAMQKIMMVSRKHKNWMLATLAVHVKLDAFTKVKEAMDKMSAELKVQQKEEVAKYDTCKTDIDATEDKIWTAKNEKEDLAGTAKSKANTLATLTASTDELKTEVAEAEVSLKSAGEQRKAQNKLFQTSMADQRATIRILQMALERLKEFYAPKAASMVQAHLHVQAASAVAPPPPKPAGYEKSSSSGGVLQLLNMIIEDAGRTEAELQSSEQSAQQEYANFVAATTASIEADREAIVNSEKEAAETKGEASETAEAQLANGASLDKLTELLSGVHTECDFLLKYFDVRQQARTEEIGSIEDAKAILSGAAFA